MKILRKSDPLIAPKIVAIIFIAAITLAVCGFLVGCKTPPQNVAVRSEAVVITSVDVAMMTWKDYVVAHPETPQAKRDAVHRAYDKYYDSQIAAKAALEVWVSAKTEGSKAAWNIAQANAVEATQAILNLVNGLIK